VMMLMWTLAAVTHDRDTLGDYTALSGEGAAARKATSVAGMQFGLISKCVRQQRHQSLFIHGLPENPCFLRGVR